MTDYKTITKEKLELILQGHYNGAKCEIQSIDYNHNISFSIRRKEKMEKGLFHKISTLTENYDDVCYHQDCVYLTNDLVLIIDNLSISVFSYSTGISYLKLLEWKNKIIFGDELEEIDELYKNCPMCEYGLILEINEDDEYCCYNHDLLKNINGPEFICPRLKGRKSILKNMRFVWDINYDEGIIEFENGMLISLLEIGMTLWNSKKQKENGKHLKYLSFKDFNVTKFEK